MGQLNGQKLRVLLGRNQDFFDETKWQELIRRPDWYLKFAALAYRARRRFGKDSKEWDDLNKRVRHFVEKALLADEINLATSGPNHDAQRQPIDTIVIHHTSAEPGYRITYMNAVQLLNIYASAYAHAKKDPDIKKGDPIWSNHTHKGRPSFIGYHWLMRMDGKFERLLDDDKIGWQAGNWDINKRSVGICLDNDYEKRDPDDKLLQQLAEHIQKNYPQVKTDKIIGHCEARKGTICPGSNFLNGWKAKLLEYVQDESQDG